MKGLAASPSELAEQNSLKQEKIVARKAKILGDLTKKLGRSIKGATMTCIVNPDTKTQVQRVA